jgi:hypothetical protein
MTYDGCPEGMYPLDPTYVNGFNDSFAEMIGAWNPTFDSLNHPFSWFFDEEHHDAPEEKHSFQLVVYMPRKEQSFSMGCFYTTPEERQEIQNWLDSDVKAAVMYWYGWGEDPDK